MDKIKRYVLDTIDYIKSEKDIKGYDFNIYNSYIDNDLIVLIYNYDVKNNYFIINNFKVVFDCLRFTFYKNNKVYGNKIQLEIFKENKKYHNDIFFNDYEKFTLRISNDIYD